MKERSTETYVRFHKSENFCAHFSTLITTFQYESCTFWNMRPQTLFETTAAFCGFSFLICSCVCKCCCRHSYTQHFSRTPKHHLRLNGFFRDCLWIQLKTVILKAAVCSAVSNLHSCLWSVLHLHLRSHHTWLVIILSTDPSITVFFWARIKPSVRVISHRLVKALSFRSHWVFGL